MKTKYSKILYFLIPMAVFAFLSAFDVLAKIDASLPLPTGAAEAPSGTSEAVKQIYFLFQFGLGAIGIVAFGSIIYGAVRYMAAAGDPSAITEAKGRIFSALWGIGIALTSVILLGTINPDLVNFLAGGKYFKKIRAVKQTAKKTIPKEPCGLYPGFCPEGQICNPPTSGLGAVWTTLTGGEKHESYWCSLPPPEPECVDDDADGICDF